MTSKQADVFDYSIKPTVDDILNGYNGTVFAYGQTGAGKSYTMMGADIDSETHKGVIPRIVEQIFFCITNSPQSMEYTVRVSYMEIYMERIRDLLNPINDNLPVHEDKGRGVYVKGLLELYVSSVQEVYEVMRRGGAARSVSATNMNQESSRSHSIFVISVSQKNVETGSTKNGNLYLVDLAGSEKVGKTGASGQTLEEAKKINKSLSTLGMVINNLTDGSKYIPYRDSKLTRILQESLGGNSRTSLIINCSPSSYNDSETLSTLRFGMRAKSIKNKAKVNTELSPAELKALLKKSQTLNLSFQEYVTSLEQEVVIWRNGDVVPQDKWAIPTGKIEGIKTSTPQRPGTPSATRPLSEVLSPRPDSRMDLRSSTPLIPWDKDEKEEFLKRENELQDQLADRESQLSAAEKALKDAKEELAFLKEHDTKTVKDNEKLSRDVNELRMQLEKISFESKEAQITMDGLKEANLELTAELSEVKQHLADVKMATKETATMVDEKGKKKAERMAKMMAGFDLGGEVFSENEKKIRQVIDRVDQLTENQNEGVDISFDDLKNLRAQLVETQGIVRQAGLSLNERTDQEAEAAKRRDELEARLLAIEQEYQELLEQSLGESDSAELKERLEKAFNNKRDVELKVLEELKLELTKKTEENDKLKANVEDLERRARVNGTGALPNGKTIAQQIAEFDVMKKSLMRDLQNRCERVCIDVMN